MFALATLLANIGTMFTDSGMRAALVQRPDRVQEAANTALLATIAGGALFALLALLAAPLVGRWTDEPRLVTLVASASVGLLLLHAGTIVPDALMQREFAFVRRLVVDPSIALTYAIVSISLCANGYGVWGLLWGTYASQVTALILVWALAKWRPQPRLASISLWREMARYGRHVLAGAIAGRVRDALETLITSGLSLGATGAFRYGRRFSLLPATAIIDVGSYVLFPTFSRMADDPPRLRAAMLRALRWLWLFAIVIAALLIALGEPVAWFLIHDEEWRLAGIVLSGVAGFGAAEAIIAVCVEGCKASGKSGMLTPLGVAAVLLGAGCMMALFPFGLLGVSIGVSVGSTGVAIYAMHLTSKALDIPWSAFMREILPPLVAAIPCGLTAWALEYFVFDAAHASRLDAAGGLAVETAAGLAVFAVVFGIVAPDRLQAIGRGFKTVGRRLRPSRAAAG